MDSKKQISDFKENTIDIRQEIERYIFHWKWFVLSIIICLSLAYLYVRYTPKQYEVSTTILVDEEGKTLSPELAAFEDMGFMGSKNNIENEIILLQSRSLMTRVVKELELNVSYWVEARVKTSELYGKSLPFKVNFLKKTSSFYSKDTIFSIQINSPTEFTLKNGLDKARSTHLFGEEVNTNFGSIVVTPLKDLSNLVKSVIFVKVNNLEGVVDGYRGSIQIAPISRDVSVVKLSLQHIVKEKAAEVLDFLVEKYNEEVKNDKRAVSIATDKFLTDRIKEINSDLSKVEQDSENFKTNHNITDVASEVDLTLGLKSELSKRIVELQGQLQLIDYIIEDISKGENKLIPENIGLSETGINTSSSEYNALILKRNTLLETSSSQNPAIIRLNYQIAQLRSGIETNLKSFKVTTQISLNQALNQEKLMKAQISTVPGKEREYRIIIRRQEVIEGLYLFLLQKSEENGLTMAVTSPNAKVIDKAYGSNAPVAPKMRIVYLSGLLIGGVIPFVVLYLIFLFDNLVHSRKDVEDFFNAPIIGDIPEIKSDKKIVVSEKDRDNVAESFRILRTNIDFMLSHSEEKCKTVFVTSTVSGEGKTFIAINIASALALTGKKVLLIGADIRKPKISDYLNVTVSKGITHYLTDRTIEIPDLIDHVDKTNFDVIHSGVLAPNPSELLMNGRFNNIIKYGKDNYDYLVIDTAPVNLVTDTLLLGKDADLFVYIVRANYLDKRFLEIPKMLYDEKRLPHMSVLVNSVSTKRSYGYGYGYGYGYEKSSFKKRVFDKISKLFKRFKM